MSHHTRVTSRLFYNTFPIRVSSDVSLARTSGESVSSLIEFRPPLVSVNLHCGLADIISGCKNISYAQEKVTPGPGIPNQQHYSKIGMSFTLWVRLSKPVKWLKSQCTCLNLDSHFQLQP